MPRISYFFGISIYMFAEDHGEPHFHAYYAESQLKIRISDAAILAGSASNRVLGLVREWTLQHQPELLANWQRCEARQAPLPVAPLD